MALMIRTNISSLDAQRHMSKVQLDQAKTFQRLASGYRINGAADDAAGLGLTEAMSAQIRSYSVAERNANDAISMAETADGAAAQIHDILGRLRELAVQSSNGSMSANDRTNLDTEFTALRDEVDRIANVTSFNGINLLGGAAATIDFQVGIGTGVDDHVGITFGGVDSAGLGVNALQVDTVANSQASITALDAAIQSLSTTREGFGANINKMQTAVATLQVARGSLTAARGRIKDVDVAEESAAMARAQVLSQAGAAVLTQANQAPQLALSLLRGG